MEPNEHTGDDAEPIVDLTRAPAVDPVTPEVDGVPSELDPAPSELDPAASDEPVVDSVDTVDAAPDSSAPLVADQGGSVPTDGGSTPDALDELTVLAGIEDDFAAAEAAMAGLDRIDAREIGGAAAAAQVEAIVGSGRFDVAG